MVSARNYSNSASDATTSALLGPGDTSVTLSNFSGFPAAPFIAALDPDTIDEEVVLVTAVSGSTATLTRAYDGTTATTHAAGSVLRHVASALDFREANAHHIAVGGVHGLTGDVVGTSDTQTLTNKTLTSPTISSPTFTGTFTAAGATYSGAVTVGSLSSGTGAFTGNVTVGGTLGVTGATTLAGLTATTGAFSGAVSTGALTAASASVTGDLTVGGTSAFTGAVTVPTPVAAGDAVRKDYADALGTDAATASTIMRRDASGNTAVDAVTLTDAPTAAGHATRKDYVDNARVHGKAAITGTGTQSVPAGAFTVVQIGTNVTQSGVLDAVGVSNRITATAACWVLVSGQIGCAIPASGRWVAAVYLNGVLLETCQNRTDTTASGALALSTGSTLIHLAANDYLQLAVRHDTGADRAIDKGQCYLSVVEVP